eukprot:8662539-Pyramimonas_sp.AAC.1
MSHSTVGACVLVELALAKGVLYALDRFANGVLSSGYICSINMSGRKQIAARLELLVVRRGPSEL